MHRVRCWMGRGVDAPENLSGARDLLWRSPAEMISRVASGQLVPKWTHLGQDMGPEPSIANWRRRLSIRLCICAVFGIFHTYL